MREHCTRYRFYAPALLPAVFVLVAFAFAVSPAYAQTGQGTITGTVTDSSGAVIPAVNVQLSSARTGFTYSATTNVEGLFRVPYLNAGEYTVTFEAQGFKRLVRSAVQVRSTETLQLNVALEIGEVVESVEVSAMATLLEAETSATGHLVTGEQLVKLPSPQMKIESMLFYVAGVTSQRSNAHSAGGRTRAFQMTNDGVLGTTPGTGSLGTGRNVSTSEHNMEEVKILTTVLPAEYGHSGGGVMSVSYKSGTNQLHGVLEERYIAKKMIHRNWQDASIPTGKAGFHLMSASISGPIKTNKTFFLWGFWRHHEKASENNDRTVPSPEMFNGDFSFPQSARADVIYDPDSLVPLAGGGYSRTAFTNNRIPIGRFSPVATKFLALNPFSAPDNRNNQTFHNTLGPANNLSADTVYRSYRTSFDTKIDHQFTDSHKIFGRWSYARHRSFQDRWQIAAQNRLVDYNATPIPIDQNQVVISDSYTISPTVINEVRVGFNRRFFERFPETLDGNWASQLGIPGVGPQTFPSFLNPTTAQLGGCGQPSCMYIRYPEGGSFDVNENMSLQENLTFIRGRHTFKTGWELMRTRHNVGVPAQASGRYNMAGTEFPFTPNTGHPFASLLLGTVGSAQYTSDLATWLPRWWSNALYFQSDYKATQKLTLNLGLRWQYESPYGTKYDRQSQFDPTATDDLTGRRGALLHPTGQLAGKDWNNFQPRMGMAYKFSDALVFRSGFAVNTLDLFTNTTLENFDEYIATANIQRPSGDPAHAFKLHEGPPAINFNIRPDGSAPFIGTNFSQRTASWFDPNMRMPYIMNWNAGVQWEFASNLLLDLNYQGSGGVGLLNYWDVNQMPLNISSNPAELEAIRVAPQNYRPYPHFGQIRLYSNFGHSTYHGGTVKLERRFSSGVSFTSFYTFSKAIDEDSDDAQATGVSYYNRALEKARSDYDVAHRWVSYWTWELPFGRGKRFLNSGGFLGHLIGNWEFNGINTIESGAPISFTHNGNLPVGASVYIPSGSGGPIGVLRPDPASGKTYDDIQLNWDRKGPCRHQAACAEPWADINAFAIPGSFQPGTIGRNIIDGPGLLWQQFSFVRVIPINERFKGTLRFDINQPFKFPFFNTPASAVDFRNPQNFGKITSTIGSFSGQGGRTYLHAIFKVEF